MATPSGRVEITPVAGQPPGTALNYLGFAVELHGPCETRAFTRALQAVVDGQPALRAEFAEARGVPVQRIVGSVAVECPVRDLSHLSACVRAEAVLDVLSDLMRARYDL